MLKIIADENVIFAEECFGSIGEVKLLPGREIKNNHIKDADVLIVRSVTAVNAHLLESTKIKFVGTTTIGEDHIDKEYLTKNKIGYSNSKGCNSQAVSEYFFTALTYLLKKKNFNLSRKTIGIIGFGNIGSKIAAISKAIGLDVIKNDPPLQRMLGTNDFRTFEEALSADIITFNVPLIKGGMDNTYHMLNITNINKVNPEAILVNTSRGSVLQTTALKELKSRAKNINFILDVWENEPHIDLELLRISNIATPHIAGYSYEGKINGTIIVYNALCKFFGLQANWQPPKIDIKDNLIKLNETDDLENSLFKIFSKNYSVEEDDKKLRKILNMPPAGKGRYFDNLRKNYPLRFELKNYILKGELTESLNKVAKLLGLNKNK